MSIEQEARMEVIAEMTKAITEQGGDGMAAMAIGMQSMMAIGEYQQKIDEKLGGNFEALLTAIEAGNYTDENGMSLNSTLTFKNLKNKLIPKTEEA